MENKNEKKIKFLFEDMTKNEKAFFCMDLIKFVLNHFDINMTDYVIDELCKYSTERKEKQGIR